MLSFVELWFAFIFSIFTVLSMFFVFCTLRVVFLKEMDLTKTEAKASLRRQHCGRMREVKQGIRRLEKFMNRISSLQTALQLMIREIPNIQEVILVLGASPIRPQHVYQMHFSHANVAPSAEADFVKGKTAEGLSRKVSFMMLFLLQFLSCKLFETFNQLFCFIGY